MGINETYSNFYANANLSKYAGQWIAVINKKVIAHNKNVKTLMKEAKEKYPAVVPFIAKVPLKEILIW
ncbi:MAG: DUF5678 domain-containing protein [Candidatus Diapherotrites archaeon]